MCRLVALALLAGLLTTNLSGKGPVRVSNKFDEFGDVKCEDEYARLDNFAIQLQNEPQATAVIIFYGGKTFRGRLPKLGEAEARAARMKPYLVQRRGIPAERIVVLNGGYAEQWLAELWIIPAKYSIPTPEQRVSIQQIRFGKGKLNPRDYRCGI